MICVTEKFDASIFWKRRRSRSSAIHVSCIDYCVPFQMCDAYIEDSFGEGKKQTWEKSHNCKYDASVSWQRGRSEASAIVQSFPNNRFISHPASTSHPGFPDETQIFQVKFRKLRKIFLFWSLRLLHKLKLNRPKCISRFFYVDSSPPKTQTIYCFISLLLDLITKIWITLSEGLF